MSEGYGSRWDAKQERIDSIKTIDPIGVLIAEIITALDEPVYDGTPNVLDEAFFGDIIPIYGGPLP